MMESAASVTALAGVAVTAARPVLLACRTDVISEVPPELSSSAFSSDAVADNPNLQFLRSQRLGTLPRPVLSCLPTSLQFRFRQHPVRCFEKRVHPANPAECAVKELSLLGRATPSRSQAVSNRAGQETALFLGRAHFISDQAPSKSGTKQITSSSSKHAVPVQVLAETAIQTDVVEPPAPIRRLTVQTSKSEDLPSSPLHASAWSTSCFGAAIVIFMTGGTPRHGKRPLDEDSVSRPG